MVTVAPISDFETNITLKGSAGRPKLDGARYPSGELEPVGKRDTGPSPAAVKKTSDEALRGGTDSIVGTSLGLLYMAGKVTASAFAAGQALGRLSGRYDRATDMPVRFTTSPGYSPPGRSPAASRRATPRSRP